MVIYRWSDRDEQPPDTRALKSYSAQASRIGPFFDLLALRSKKKDVRWPISTGFIGNSPGQDGVRWSDPPTSKSGSMHNATDAASKKTSKCASRRDKKGRKRAAAEAAALAAAEAELVLREPPTDPLAVRLLDALDAMTHCEDCGGRGDDFVDSGGGADPAATSACCACSAPARVRGLCVFQSESWSLFPFSYGEITNEDSSAGSSITPATSPYLYFKRLGSDPTFKPPPVVD